ncbi:MAG TPA: aminotransferase class IV, partial [Rhodocyclaceae bacterium]|nr:aminotransferase class IV [Rhodocyclaceae bacterium]
ANPHDPTGWATIVEQLVAANPWDDQGIYLQVTRGADVKRDHPFPAVVTPTVFGMSMPLVMPSAEVRERGIAAVTAEDTRWQRCDLKATSLLANVLRQQSVDAGAGETILLRDGLLTEGSAASVLIVRDGTLIAPPQSHLILPGVTYDVVLELAAQHGLPCAIRPITEAELRAADEVWLLSSTKEILAVTTLDGQPVGAGIPGPVGRQMWQWYQAYKNT